VINKEQAEYYRGYRLPLYTEDWLIDIQMWSKDGTIEWSKVG
jgi:hypothetical protein